VSTRYVYVDETKRAGYFLVAVSVTDPAAACKVIRGLMLPRQSRLHMVRENPVRASAGGGRAELCLARRDRVVLDQGRELAGPDQARPHGRPDCLTLDAQNPALPTVRKAAGFTS
jgi:hypothetical protein